VTSNFAADPPRRGASRRRRSALHPGHDRAHLQRRAAERQPEVDLRRDLLARFSVSEDDDAAGLLALAAPVSLTRRRSASRRARQRRQSRPEAGALDQLRRDAGVVLRAACAGCGCVFYMDLTQLRRLRERAQELHDLQQRQPGGALVPYDLTIPINTSGKVKGVELAYEQPLFGNFGVGANYTYADGHESGGGPLVGTSRNTYNLCGYYEDDRFNARLAYTYRSKFYSGLDRQTAFSQDAIGSLSASLGYVSTTTSASPSTRTTSTTRS
jgi:iron complex outermembrane receptor protein